MNDNKLDLKSLDIKKDKIGLLKKAFPEVVTEGKVDFERLKNELGEEIEIGKERYEMKWPGKSSLQKIIQQPSIGTLKPIKEASVDFDNTENLFIEGDNLEVLKLLQKSYYGKIKMIYTDPPYNTGKDFIYPDNYTESLDTYLRYTGQKGERGLMLTTNTETEGRYHSKWMNMMYPRLFLARNLLRDDGVVFISIDDHEVDNLKKICNEIFGEENFLGCLIWNTNHSAQAGVFKVYHQYVLVYAKYIKEIKVPKSDSNDVFEAGAMKRESQRHSLQTFKFPAGTRVETENDFELTGKWGDVEAVELIEGRFIVKNKKLQEDVSLQAAWTQKNQMQQFFYGDRNNIIDSRGQKVVEFFFTSKGKLKILKERGVFSPSTTLPDYGSQGSISTNLAELFQLTESPINNPKSPQMIGDFIKWFCDSQDTILDFFSGSATTAHAVLDLNKQDGGNRKYIMVQLQEPTDENSEAYKAGYKNIAEIGEERIRRVIKKIKEENEGKLDLDKKKLDLGFKVFRLSESNFRIWDKSPDQPLEEQLKLSVDNINPDSSELDILHEIILKSGFPLTVPVQKLTVKEKTVYSIDDKSLLVCLENNLTQELMNELSEMEAVRVVFLDRGFNANDQLKTNTVERMKVKGVEFRTV